MRRYWVYIMASRSRRLYVGVTRDLARRVYEHKAGLTPGFTSRYRVTRLVHIEWTTDVEAAIAREKDLKRWPRTKKIPLIEAANPRWLDLAADWFPDLRDEPEMEGRGGPAPSHAPLGPSRPGR